jgi:hypothetical protein
MSFRKLFVSLAVLLLVLAGYQACRRSQAPSPGSDHTSPKPASTQSTFTARSGRIYTDKLFWGLLLLEDSQGHAVSPEQAAAILTVLEMLQRKLTKNEYYDQLLEGVLRPEQKAFLESTAAKLTEDQLHATVDPSRMAHVEQVLVNLAGIEAPAPDTDIAVPEGIEVQARPLRISRMMAFMVSFEPLMAQSDLAITPEQARDLLPTVFSYVNLKNSQRQSKREILGILRDDQKDWIDANVVLRTDGLLDMTALQSQVRDLMTTRAAGSSKGEIPARESGRAGADATR